MSSTSKSNPLKRKRVVLSLDHKLSVCDMVRQKRSKVDIMAKFNIARRTLNDICKSEDNLRKFKGVKNETGTSSSFSKLKSMKIGSYKELDTALYIWFCQKRELGIPITGPILMEKAQYFFNRLYPDSSVSFSASKGFQQKFCQRFGIKRLAVCGEKLSADSKSAERFVSEFKALVEGYSLDQLFNADETGLYYKLLPKTTLSSAKDDPIGAKKQKERVTINACANASGTIKLPLLMIGKSKKPRCFKRIDQTNLPVIYKSQKSAWMDLSIFGDWFHNVFVPQVRKDLEDLGQEKKAILFIDNCAAHPGEEKLISDDGKIIAKFFPPNVTSLIQPMDQGILESLKRLYRKFILREILYDDDVDVVASLKKIDLLKVAYNISTAWDKVEISTLKKAWNGILKPETQSDISQPFNLEIEQFVSVFGALKLNVTSNEVEAWFQGDGPGYEHLDENAIVDMVTADDQQEEEEEDDEDEPSGIPRVTNTEAMECTDTLLRWIRAMPNASPQIVSTLINLRELAAERRSSSQKQTIILSFLMKDND